MTTTDSARSSVSSASSNGSSLSSAPSKGAASDGGQQAPAERTGISWPMASFFLLAQMAGAGFLSLPMALNNTGWLGAPMMVLLCAAVGLAGVCLGISWVILEERWPEEYGNTVRQPYMDIAYRALGEPGRQVALWSVILTLIGGSTVFIILMAQLTNAITSALSTCEWVLVYGALLLPFTWLGTPKDFWQASVMAVGATVIACLVVFVMLFVTHEDDPFIQYPNPTVSSFSLGFGAILFAFGGASTFPTIQNDMKDRTQFWKSVIVGFLGALSLYLPVAAAGYGLLGNTVAGNILLSVGLSPVVKVAIVTEIINLLGTYLISFNPIGQSFEEMLKIPNKFCVKRVAMRSSVVLIEVLICLAIPDFGLILNLIGGSTVTLSSFVLPPIMYMRLVDNADNTKWPKRSIPLWLRIALWEIVLIGAIGGITSTVFAVIDILNPDSFGKSCFVDFT
ncbi:amino acid transporter ANT1-like [Hyalella azteca]|uniref:Amino acid transporter ANT1-like n=1 Tax=Hyalella azteca TaxID=294128 RepID=A0A6A0HG90_HYAAZ|nr:amino acid transporter AVT1B [Hyalella azteca]KAA0203467.1 amino acid transporter ANT1-like [Hyalella azteca]